MAGKFDKVKDAAIEHAPHGKHHSKHHNSKHNIKSKAHSQNETTLTGSASSSTPDVKQSPPFVLPPGMKLADPSQSIQPATIIKCSPKFDPTG